MKEEINYFYRIYPEILYNEKNYYYFNIGNIKYYLVNPAKTERELNIILTIFNEYKKRNFLIDEIVLNIDSSYISNINGDNYLLVKKNETDEEKDLKFINAFDKLIKTKRKDELGYITYDVLWGKKIDYYESIINEVSNEKIKEYFDYYVGLAENAVTYVKHAYIEEKDDDLTIAHRNIDKNFNNILNPFNLIIDYEVRDIAQYIKVKFFNSIFIFNELEEILSKNNYSAFLIRLLFSRLLYPDYYFKLIDKNLKGSVTEKEINNIIDKNKEYEEFLVEVYDLLFEYAKIPKIEWLYRK